MAKNKNFIQPLEFNKDESGYLASVKERSYGKAILPQFINQEIKEDFYFIYNNDNIAFRGELALWRAVILQAGIDLVSKSKKRIAQTYRWKAFQWFNLRNEEFKQVCGYAGLDADYVLERIKPKKDEAVKFMEENIMEVS